MGTIHKCWGILKLDACGMYKFVPFLFGLFFGKKREKSVIKQNEQSGIFYLKISFMFICREFWEWCIHSHSWKWTLVLNEWKHWWKFLFINIANIISTKYLINEFLDYQRGQNPSHLKPKYCVLYLEFFQTFSLLSNSFFCLLYKHL